MPAERATELVGRSPYAMPLAPTAALVAMIVLGSIGTAVYGVMRVALSPQFSLLYYVGIGWALAWWVEADSRERHVPVPVDLGWFVFYAWAIAVPYHLLRTRRAAGCVLMLIVLGLYFGGWSLAAVAIAVARR